MGVAGPASSVIDVAQFVSEFGAQVDAQSAALFVGAGPSIAAGYPSWDALVAPYCAHLGITEDDLPLVVQYFQDASVDGSARVRADIMRMVRALDPAPNTTHRRLLGLPVPDVWTTNYDTLLEKTARERDVDMTVYAEDADLATILPSPKRLYKMHGTVDATTVSRELVISRDDFDHYPTSHPRFWHLLQATFLTSSFLFVGFSLSDPNMAEILRLARLATPDVKRPHYAILKRESGPRAKQRIAALRRDDLARVGIHVVEIDEHSDVDTVLGRLGARCRPPRAYLSGSINEEVDGLRAEAIAGELGAQLANQPDIRLMAGNDLGASVGYALSRARQAAGTYRPEDFIVVRRVRDEAVSSPNFRWGSMLFHGENAELLRTEAFEHVRAVVVLGGAKRTREEIALAKQIGMGVIAIGAAGGVAGEQWASDVKDLAYRLGERPVERLALQLLNDDDPAKVARATIRLLRQALFLD